MQIRFADTRPTGDFALVLPAAGTVRPGLDSLGAAKPAVEAALKRSASRASPARSPRTFVDGDGGRRLLLVGIGDRRHDRRCGARSSAARPSRGC